MNRVKDQEGHLWPVTGYRCDICGWPMIPTDGYTTHPTCGSSNT